MTKEMVCINCPLGCRLQVEMQAGTATAVTGNRCKRGQDYAVQEAVCPLRVLTGNMRAHGCERPFPVRSSAPIPKAMLILCSQELRRIRPAPPIQVGDVVIRDILGTKVDIIATQGT
ncbi:MAG: DUF1667 domain-containing protein [Oscillospiraceae bacterium]|nr:DUF1667 domain-containing protein [Oscillospiraceae bacterium]